MLVKLLVFSVMFITSSHSYANPAAIGLEMGWSTADDIKSYYKIKEQSDYMGGTTYQIDVLSISPERSSRLGKFRKASVWCDNQDDIQHIMLITDRKEFDNIVFYFSNIYKFISCEPAEDRRSEVELVAKFEDGDYSIVLHATQNSHDLTIDYYAPEFKNRNYKPKQ